MQNVKCFLHGIAGLSPITTTELEFIASRVADARLASPNHLTGAGLGQTC